MNLYFVRHGESEANVLHVISNRGYRHGLTEKGRQQALELAGRLKEAVPARIYTSPLMRAVQTAEILTGILKAPIKIAQALREYDCGVLEGKSDEASWTLHRQVQEDWLKRGLWERRIEGGESLCEARDRFMPFIRRILEEKQGEETSVVLIGHGGLFKCVLPLVLANVSFAFAGEQPFPNTGYVLARTTPEGLACVEWCGKAFL
jgi:broad specificity phosphatase PhoE